MIDLEKKSNFTLRTSYSKEMEMKKELESILRSCIEDVRDEIAKKKNETQNIYKQVNKQLTRSLHQPFAGGTDQLTVQEKERIIEVLQSQERVLTLLYDKTFPPRKESKGQLLAMFSSRMSDAEMDINNNDDDEL